ncbi:MAG: hypothetical protein K0R38_6524 [Polyangiaceae bacterium]|jgi:hypothetical protein|nr:hypothetical protein [Polyangiaceae bacterium]
MRRGQNLGALALFAGLLGCSAEPALPSWQERIVEGEVSGSDQDGVLLLRGLLSDNTEFVCTATLVAPNLVLTAQHCVSYLSNGPFSCNARGELTDNVEGGGQLGLGLPPERIELYSAATPRDEPLARARELISARSTNICQNDIAFVVLDTALNLPVAPIRVGRPARVGELGVLVGYGLGAGERGIDYRTQNREQKRDLEIRGVGPDSVEDGVTTVPPRSLVLEGPAGCIGDSGGPLLAQSTGAILGVYSLQTASDCTSPRVAHQLVHLPPFELLVRDAFEAAGATPLLEEPEMASFGGAGSEAAGAGGQSGNEPPPGGAPAEVPSEPQRSSSSCSHSGAPRGRLLWWAWLAPFALLALRKRRSATSV